MYNILKKCNKKSINYNIQNIFIYLHVNQAFRPPSASARWMSALYSFFKDREPRMHVWELLSMAYITRHGNYVIILAYDALDFSVIITAPAPVSWSHPSRA